MPPSYYDLVKGGLADFRMDDLRISKHAIQQAKKRGIPLEDLRRKHGNKAGYAVTVGKTVVTALTNQMQVVNPTARKNRFRVMEIRWKIENIGVCPSLRVQRPESYAFFHELFQHHPEPEKKRVAEIKDISLEKFGKGPIRDHQDLRFRLYYGDGTSDTISWRKCIV